MTSTATVALANCHRPRRFQEQHLCGYYCQQGAGAPLPCPAGTANNPALSVLTSEDDCLVCPAGTFCPTGAEEATNCAAGTFNDAAAQPSCTPCAPGEYQDGDGATGCKACTPGHFCDAGTSAPLPCPGGTNSSAEGLASGAGPVGAAAVSQQPPRAPHPQPQRVYGGGGAGGGGGATSSAANNMPTIPIKALNP